MPQIGAARAFHLRYLAVEHRKNPVLETLTGIRRPGRFAPVIAERSFA